MIWKIRIVLAAPGEAQCPCQRTGTPSAQPLPLILFLCVLGAHCAPGPQTRHGSADDELHSLLRLQQQIFSAIEDLSNEHCMLAMTVDREHGAAFKVHTQVCTSCYTHTHRTLSWHFDEHILTLERTPTRIMTRMRRRDNGGFLELMA